MPIAVYLADESDYIREGLRVVLEGREGVRVVGDASDGKAAVEEAGRLHPDVVVMDVAMPRCDGIEATAQLRAASPDTRVILLSMSGTTEHVLRALHAGARGYLLKNSAAAELLAAVRAVHAGRRFVSHMLAETLADEYLRHAIHGTVLVDPVALPAAASVSVGSTPCQAVLASPRMLEVCRQQLIRDIAEADAPSVVKLAILHGLVLPE